MKDPLVFKLLLPSKVSKESSSKILVNILNKYICIDNKLTSILSLCSSNFKFYFFLWILICELKFAFETSLSQMEHFVLAWPLKWFFMFETNLQQILHSVFGSWHWRCFFKLLLEKLLWPQILHSNKRNLKWALVMWSIMKSRRWNAFGHWSVSWPAMTFVEFSIEMRPDLVTKTEFLVKCSD